MKYKWTIAVVVIMLSIIIFFVFGRGGDDSEIAKNNLFNIDFAKWADIEEAKDVEKDFQTEVIDNGNEKAGDFETSPQNRLLYTDEKYNFSFLYPFDATVGSFKEEEGDMILIQNKGIKKSAQIFIIPFDEPMPISKTRILKDLPNMIIKDEQKGTVGGHQAIAFLGQHTVLGDTYEIWFVRDENLYQIMTKAKTAQFLIDIIKTWTEY